MSEGQRSDWSCCAILPPEIIEDVLSRLPVKSLCRFKCVSPSWKSLISSPHFSKTHLNRTNTNNPKHLDRKIILIHRFRDIYSLDLTAGLPPIATRIDFPLLQQCENKFVKVTNSCNGLVLVSSSGYLVKGNPNLFLLNPSTRQCKKLPRRPLVHNPFSVYTFGVGYDSSKDDYKVVMLSRPDVKSGSESGSSNLRDATIVAVYSLENDAWRRLQGTRYSIAGCGVYCNGRLHWFCWSDVPSLLVAFDLADEIFREVPLPASLDNYESLQYHQVVIIGGNLCLGYVADCEPFEFWMMKEYGDRESWAKLFIATYPMNLRGLVEDNEYMLVTRPQYLFSLYNPETGMVRDIVAPTPNEPWDTYVESLISPIR